MHRRLWTAIAAISLFALGAAPALGQQAGESPAEARESATRPIAPDADAEEKRAYVRGVLEENRVAAAARSAGADIDGALAGIDALEGERLDRATRQAQLIDSRLDETITLSVTTIIIILLLIILIVVAA
ncbi:MAG: hypothetical protein R3199_06670 [Gemmatimonadota bacterium]|nr:hypothetical protein [Gemmatimonadota bacterium]